MLQEALQACRLHSPGHSTYANVVSSSAQVIPHWLGGQIQTELSDTSFIGLVLHNHVALFSVYLPDSGKSDHLYERALDELSVGLEVARNRFSVRSFVLVGDWNAELMHIFGAEPGDVQGRGILGPTLPSAAEGNIRISERQDMILSLCARFGLHHGPSHLFGPLEGRWTREGWGASRPRTTLDFVLLSDNLKLLRWSPWPLSNWPREKRRLWGDHRPCFWAVSSREGQPKLYVPRRSSAPNYKGWQPQSQADLVELHGKLHAWAVRSLDSVHRVPSSSEVSSAILALSTSIPFSTWSSRAAEHIACPPRLRQLRLERRSLDRGSAALRANRCEERRLVRARETKRFARDGGLKRRRFLDTWRSVSFLSFSEGGARTCDRAVWRAELVQHWSDRFSDPLDPPAAQEHFRRELFQGDVKQHVLRPSFGEVVIALSGAKCGSSGGRDGLVAEMLLSLPWKVVILFWHLFNARFRHNWEMCLSNDESQDAAGCDGAADIWREYMAAWIRKDRESDLLSSFRPIMQSSVVTKWIGRLCLGPRPEVVLLSRAPLWGFRPRLCAARLAIAAQFVIHGMLNYTAPLARYQDGAGGATGEGDMPGVMLFVDVEKAFDCMQYPSQLLALRAAGIEPARAAAYMCEFLHSSVWVRLGDVEVGPLPHSRGKQGGCATPFVFNAMMAEALRPCYQRWWRQGWGIRVPGVNCAAPRHFLAGVFADNLVLAGTVPQVVAMYDDISRAIARMHFRRKPSSFSALGPVGCTLTLPAVGAQAARSVACQQVVPWLGQSVAYREGWDIAYDRAFESANAAWNANRKVLYNRRLSLRCRLTAFSQTTASVLLARLSVLPLSVAVLHRIRRLEARFFARAHRTSAYCPLAECFCAPHSSIAAGGRRGWPQRHGDLLTRTCV